jgi:hypothetical protein
MGMENILRSNEKSEKMPTDGIERKEFDPMAKLSQMAEKLQENATKLQSLMQNFKLDNLKVAERNALEAPYSRIRGRNRENEMSAVIGASMGVSSVLTAIGMTVMSNPMAKMSGPENITVFLGLVGGVVAMSYAVKSAIDGYKEGGPDRREEKIYDTRKAREAYEKKIKAK